MKKIFGISILLLIFNCVYSQGLIFDSSSFSKQQEFPVDRSALPFRTSLEMYLPILYPQTGGTCVAMSISLARTIMYVKSAGITDVAEITRNQFSPYFIYYYARDKNDISCEKGLNPVDAFTVAQKIGFEKMIRIEYPNYYPFSKSFLCPNTFSYLPPETEQHIINANKFKISEIYVTKNVNGIKSALAKGMPVVLAMQIPKSFEILKGVTWKSFSYENRTNASGHAMVAIGYDDDINGGSIRVANSWGSTWGDKGKVWIQYNELERWLDGAFIMVPSKTTYSSDGNTSLGGQNLLKEQNFKVSDYSGRFKYNNKDYIKAFSENN
jgi:hypothetical protein